MPLHLPIDRYPAAFVLSALLGFVPTHVSAQAGQDSGQKTPDTRTLVTLLGCVTAPVGKEKTFTLSEVQGGEKYALQGVDVRDFVGRRVEISGNHQRRRLVIRGGLYPNANMAGQAGDIDPTRAAMAAQAGPEANTPRPTPEFRVRSVRAVEGGCPDARP
jgi:hypothetical protein